MSIDLQLALQYALAKQLPRATAIESNYGPLQLDEELRAAVENALAPILERRLAELANTRRSKSHD